MKQGVGRRIVSPTPSWRAWRGGRGGTPGRLDPRVALCESRTKPVRRRAAQWLRRARRLGVLRRQRHEGTLPWESDSCPSIQPGQAGVAWSPAMVTKTS